MTSNNIPNDTLSTVNYHLDFKHFNQHLVQVTLTFKSTKNRPTVWLPSWIPGSYLMREFARNITAVTYQIVSDKEEAPKRAEKISKNEWCLPTIREGEQVKVEYEVYCYDLSVRTAYVDQTRLYGNFTSIALAVSGRENDAVAVTLSVPQAFYDIQTTRHYNSPEHVNESANLSNEVNNSGNSADERTIPQVKLACGLSHTYLHTTNHHYYNVQVDSYHELIDYPFEIAVQDEFDFIIHDTHQQALPHRFYISGKHSANLGRLQQDVTHICQTYLNWLGDAPFVDYTFMTYASGNDYGGLEHINSTSLVIPRSDLPCIQESDEPSEAYQRFLGLCSHEYFHSWWVKTVRPDVMLNVDLRREAYTPLLWVFEGFTSYIDDFMLQASNVISVDSYLKLLGTQINRYTQTHGRHLQSVAESSFDAWIKLYRADENTGNAGISYYNKGALVALCLDLILMQKSAGKYRLFDVVSAFYTKAKAHNNNRIGMTDDNLSAVIYEFMDKADWDDFVARYINGVDALPIGTLLESNGVSLDSDDKDNTLAWGMSVKEISEGLKIIKVLRDSVAGDAGLSAKDIIVAIDGVKATKKHLDSVAASGLDSVVCHAFRRDELITFMVANKTASGIDANPSLEKVVLSLNESGFKDWLTPNFVK